MINKFEMDYKGLLLEVLTIGKEKENRTEVNTISAFNQSLTIDLEDGFPICTSKQVFFDKARAEYEWMIMGLTTTTYLHKHGIRWWDEYANAKGELGKTYGYQIRNFNGEVDQLDYIHRQIRMKTRRAHMTLWNPSDLNQVVLPPCFTGMTFMELDGKLNMSVQFRSSDLFLGLPYDIIVFSLMLHEIASFNELKPGKLGIQITDAHIYDNHIDAVFEYVRRDIHKLPILHIDTDTGNKRLVGYKHEPFIYAKMNN